MKNPEDNDAGILIVLFVALIVFLCLLGLALSCSNRDKENCYRHGGHLASVGKGDACITYDGRIIENYNTRTFVAKKCPVGYHNLKDPLFGNVWVCGPN